MRESNKGREGEIESLEGKERRTGRGKFGFKERERN